MIITETIFQAFLQCQLKAYLINAQASFNKGDYTTMQEQLKEKYNKKCIYYLTEVYNKSARTTSSPAQNTIKNNLLFDYAINNKEFNVNIHAIQANTPLVKENIPACIPIRYVADGKISKHNKLMLAMDALSLFSLFGKMPIFGKLVCGNPCSLYKIRLSEPVKEARSKIAKLSALIENKTLPETILNKNCSECDFRFRCRQEAMEKDELTLISSINEKERKRYNNKGIFTVTQLSYTFRPRKPPKEGASKPFKYYHSLKALAIRDKKIYVSGKPELNVAGTPVFIDVEGLPNQDFFYLIGIRFKNGPNFVHESLWAEDKLQEKAIWDKFLRILCKIDRPQLLYYGKYEGTFLRLMRKRYVTNQHEQQMVDGLIAKSINILSAIYSHIYFPTYSNNLKEIANFLGFFWSEKDASGLKSILWRQNWELTKYDAEKQRILDYNAEDCQALQIVTNIIMSIITSGQDLDDKVTDPNIVHTENMKSQYPYKWGPIDFALPELDYINKCAYWDYQRDKIYIRSNPRLKQAVQKKIRRHNRTLPINKIFRPSFCYRCPTCDSIKILKKGHHSKLTYDIKFTRFGVKKWITKHFIKHFKCAQCGNTFSSDKCFWTKHLYGADLLAYVIYHIIELNVSQVAVAQSMNELFGYRLCQPAINKLKRRASEYYHDTYESIVHKLATGHIIHADETKVNAKGKNAFVWVFTSLEEVIYVFSETREGDIVKTLFGNFKGVLVSDFYAAYDSLNCPQQKCLIHLIRDLNDDLLKHPFNEEMKLLVQNFAVLVKPIISTIDKFGLKKHFLNRYKDDVDKFFELLFKGDYATEIGISYQKRFAKNREKLFTFLDYDGVPWNNNNAEHAIKAFAGLREVIRGSSNEEGIRDYLVLLSICQTCKYKGVPFLDFLRSRKQNVDDFAKNN